MMVYAFAKMPIKMSGLLIILQVVVMSGYLINVGVVMIRQNKY